jgi:hypothetical protein
MMMMMTPAHGDHVWTMIIVFIDEARAQGRCLDHIAKVCCVWCV